MTGVRLTDEQRIDWLRLIRTEGVGPRTFRALLNQHGGAASALEVLPALARKGGRAGLKIASRAEAEREIAAAARIGVRLVALGEPDYPKTLQAVDAAPPMLAVRGEAAVLSRPTVAIVGSRNASASGLAFTERLARDLGRAGFVVVSGLARGVDTRAHAAALSTGTVAVMAGGHERIYPPENEPLLERILGEGGAVISEMPLGWEPRGRDFPRRNRIVSGLSYGVVVVEAARRSGSLITARFALEQGREVFAVPGSPMDPRAEGTNALIRDGATLCAAAEHVIAALEPLVGSGLPDGEGAFEPPARHPDLERLWDELDFLGVAPAPETTRDPYDAGEGFGEGKNSQFEEETPRVTPPPGGGPAALIALLGPAPVSVDDLVRQSGLPVRVIQSTLLELEMAGRLERHGSNSVSLRPAAAPSA